MPARCPPASPLWLLRSTGTWWPPAPPPPAPSPPGTATRSARSPPTSRISARSSTLRKPVPKPPSCCATPGRLAPPPPPSSRRRGWWPAVRGPPRRRSGSSRAGGGRHKVSSTRRCRPPRAGPTSRSPPTCSYRCGPWKATSSGPTRSSASPAVTSWPARCGTSPPPDHCGRSVVPPRNPVATTDARPLPPWPTGTVHQRAASEQTTRERNTSKEAEGTAMPGRVEGKVAFVTGAARGQGRSHAVRLAQEGADIIAVDICAQVGSVPYAMSTPADLADTVKEVEALDRRIVATQADTRDYDGLKQALDDGVGQLGRVDSGCSNAGMAAFWP